MASKGEALLKERLHPRFMSLLALISVRGIPSLAVHSLVPVGPLSIPKSKTTRFCAVSEMPARFVISQGLPRLIPRPIAGPLKIRPRLTPLVEGVIRSVRVTFRILQVLSRLAIPLAIVPSVPPVRIHSVLLSIHELRILAVVDSGLLPISVFAVRLVLSKENRRQCHHDQ